MGSALVIVLGGVIPWLHDVAAADARRLALRGKVEVRSLDGASMAAEVDAQPVACTCASAGGRPWARLRSAAAAVFGQPDFARRVIVAGSPAHTWTSRFPCPEIPPPEGPRGLAALSDCAPGVVLMHVVCAQRLLLELRFTDAQYHFVEALQALPFAAPCLDAGDGPGGPWPLSVGDVHSNYIRLYRALSYYHPTPYLVPDLVWTSTRSCASDGDCLIGEVCGAGRCSVPAADGANASKCAPDGDVTSCREGETCSSVQAPSGTDCVLALEPACVHNGELEVFHPRTECLPVSSFPRMIKACSEMGTTLYPLHWSSVPLEDRLRGKREGEKVEEPGSWAMQALVLPVTLRLRSPWHMLHSLVPAFAQVAMDDRFGLRGDSRQVELLLVDQDLDKDRHIWDKVLGESKEGFGELRFLLGLLSDVPYRLMADIQSPRCYGRLVWGHELMLYSGGGWTNATHMNAFASAGRSFVGGNVVPATQSLADGFGKGPQLLLVERREGTSWGRWIDNWDDVVSAAADFAAQYPRLLGSVHVADLADLAPPEQLRLVGSMGMVFGAHGDGLSWIIFAGEGAALLEAVPGRDRGFQVCVEGLNENPSGIFGGLARLARQIHVCWLNPASKVRPYIGGSAAAPRRLQWPFPSRLHGRLEEAV